jgi:hypothetical protein
MTSWRPSCRCTAVRRGVSLQVARMA